MRGLLYRGLVMITAIAVMTSCDRIETKKISSSEYLSESWKAIDLHKVDGYPTFDTCSSQAEGEALRVCFEETVTSTFYESFGKHTIVVNRELNDTIVVNFVVNEKGKYCIDTLAITPEIRAEIPKLEQWIHEAAKQLPQAKAATKQGVPVKTKFKIPVVLKVE
ncbi:hypothetical protein [uncultured Dokdonia sp.]|uniref:hypothetical protein n=1 Tax=unclassified Dokdonia TaxID=2615033 RepID=UPI002609F80A|nr:hypothetical protein [uncultured Dokdonia sp.]